LLIVILSRIRELRALGDVERRSKEKVDWALSRSARDGRTSRGSYSLHTTHREQGKRSKKPGTTFGDTTELNVTIEEPEGGGKAKTACAGEPLLEWDCLEKIKKRFLKKSIQNKRAKERQLGMTSDEDKEKEVVINAFVSHLHYLRELREVCVVVCLSTRRPFSGWVCVGRKKTGEKKRTSGKPKDRHTTASYCWRMGPGR